MKKERSGVAGVNPVLLVLLAAFLAAVLPGTGPGGAEAGAGAGNIRYKVTAVLPHDPEAFTQGLFYADGWLYESTGLYGHSTLRKVDPKTGRAVTVRDLDASRFGEGLALSNGRLYQLTWKAREVYVYDAATLEKVDTLRLDREGWGVASTPFGLVTSDGSNQLVWRDPGSFAPVRAVPVTDAGRPVTRLNELEWVDGFVLANVWHEDRIAVISPATGQVAAWIDCSALRARTQGLPEESDLNGIAWDPSHGVLYVTGKNWPNLYEITLERLPGK